MEKKNAFLESKIQTPAASRNFLVRERLIHLLNNAEERVVIVSAGMGFGKTVLLTHYAKHYPEKCAWYHLSDTDNDIMVFARYLCKSVEKVAPTFSVDFSPYLALDQNEALVSNLALDFAAALRGLGERELCLILDDFQTIENEWIFQFLTDLWDNDHGSLRLFLGTKSAPPAFCARYLLRHEAMVLGAESLAFNLEEIKTLIQDYTAPEILEEGAKAVQTYVEGWPAGVSFTTLYFRQRQVTLSEQELEQACQQRYLWDYFMQELFRKLPFALQHFLTCTSVLDYLRPDVCNVLANIDNAASQLTYLEQENLFILRLSGSGRIYRYHSIFRSFLNGQLQSSRRIQLLKRATDFYLCSPDKAQAAEYAIACNDGERLQCAVEGAGAEALTQGQLNTLSRWLDELQATGIPPTPTILLLRGQYCERTGDWQRAVELAEQVLSAKAEERPQVEAQLLLARVEREVGEISKSLAVLELLLPTLRPERSGYAPLYRQAVELRIHNLLDLGRYRQALALTLAGLEASAQRQDQRALSWYRELAVVCHFVMGDYHRAMQFYVILRSNGGGGIAQFFYLYQAISGRAKQALERLNQALESTPEGTSRHTLENFLLTQSLVARLAEMETGRSWGGEEKNLWESWISTGAVFDQSFGGIAALLRRALTAEGLSPAQETDLFRLDSGRLITLQDGARWLTVRRCIRRGEREQALALCALSRSVRSSWCAPQEEGEVGRKNAFLAFLTLEEALLLQSEQPEQAADQALRCARYLEENRLHCPGLTPEERQGLERLLAGKRLSRPPAGEHLSGWTDPVAEVHCFGRFRVLLPDGGELSWRTRKAEELFAYLFHLNGASVDRERLLDILWPQSPPNNATSLLHTSLYSLRKSLVPYGLEGLFQRDRKGYRMDMALVRSPRAGVEALCRGEIGEESQPEVLYEGPYLEDIEAAWPEDSRAWYAGAFLRACRSRATEEMAAGHYPQAAQSLRAAIGQEPYDEGLAGLLIRCYAAMGELKNATALYKRLKEVLYQELGEEPGQEVTQIYRECLLKRLGSGRSQHGA